VIVFLRGKPSCGSDERRNNNRPVYALPTYFVFHAFIIIRIVRAKKIVGIMPRINNKYEQRTTELESSLTPNNSLHRTARAPRMVMPLAIGLKVFKKRKAKSAKMVCGRRRVQQAACPCFGSLRGR
jgi:hypothetical protein